MWPMKDGYNFIVVNFGGYQYCRTLSEAIIVADKMQPDKGSIYSRGFYSEKVGRIIGQDKWFFYDEEKPANYPS